METASARDLTERERALADVAADILREAKAAGASAAETSLTEDEGLAVAVRQRALETVEFNRERGFAITVYDGARKGSASTSEASAEAIRATVGAAMDIARHTQEDSCNGLADAHRLAVDWPPLDLSHPWQMDADRLRDLALEMEAAALDFDGRIVNSEGARSYTQSTCQLYANSLGFVGAVSATRHGAGCAVIAEDGDGMERDHWYTVARDPAELQAAAEVGEEAGRRTVARLGKRPIKTGSWPVLFSPRLAAGLVSHLLGAISGGAQYRRASYLLDALGEDVAAPCITLAEHPHLPKALGSAGFDGEGVATAPKAFVEQGHLASYVLSSYSARRLKRTTTGNAGGVFNLVVECDQTPVAALMEEMGTGLVVNELMGQGVNLVTGDYSRGAAGIWVEGGKPAFPVGEVTIASNLKDILLGVVGMGDDVDRRGNVHSGSLLVREMTVAT